MRGYVSFILVFVSIAVILTILSASFSFDPSRAIAFKRMQSLELDLKNSMLDAAHSAAEKTVREYVKEKLAQAALTGTAPVFSAKEINEMKAKAKAAAYAELQKFSRLVIQNFDFVIWCGYPSKTGLQSTAEKMVAQQSVLYCDGYTDIGNELCKEFIDVEPQLGNLANPRAKVNLVSTSFTNGIGFIGISAYSKHFALASAGYVPAAEGRE